MKSLAVCSGEKPGPVGMSRTSRPEETTSKEGETSRWGAASLVCAVSVTGVPWFSGHNDWDRRALGRYGKD